MLHYLAFLTWLKYTQSRQAGRTTTGTHLIACCAFSAAAAAVACTISCACCRVLLLPLFSTPIIDEQ